MDRNITTYVAANIRLLRTQRRMTQQMLADRAGVTATTVVHLETSRTWLRPDMVQRIADALEVDPSRLFRNPYPDMEKDAPSPHQILEEVTRMINAVAWLPRNLTDMLATIRDESEIYVLIQTLEDLRAPKERSEKPKASEARPKKTKILASVPINQRKK